MVCALLHDIGDTLGPYNHADIAAAIVQPFVSEENHWIVEHHAIFQGYYYFHFLGLDRDMREKFRGHPHFEKTEEFCRLFDQVAFDPNFRSMPLAAFEPMLRKLFPGLANRSISPKRRDSGWTATRHSELDRDRKEGGERLVARLDRPPEGSHRESPAPDRANMLAPDRAGAAGAAAKLHAIDAGGTPQMRRAGGDVVEADRKGADRAGVETRFFGAGVARGSALPPAAKPRAPRQSRAPRDTSARGRRPDE